ncbi:hypothetical protein EGW08_004867 [Elysia chlorotica]|uniref:DDE-1 domain-containing protein n=1 Tax=Elysia chlorotica TaxID=188477 RepID=A0A3S1A094_ELYCH|nr:hypothetical protein EGW08_004867 [Elysia chlorotica]
MKWLHHFVNHAKPSKEDQHILILDGHHSHKTLEAVEFASENGIHMITLPPHCTHKLQPCDKTFFKPLKNAYNTAADNWMLSHPAQRITMFDIAGIFGTAYTKAATMAHAVNGFAACGIWPFNDDMFTDNDFAPSMVTDVPLPTNNPPAPASAIAGPSICTSRTIICTSRAIICTCGAIICTCGAIICTRRAIICTRRAIICTCGAIIFTRQEALTRRKIQVDKKAPPDAIVIFNNELFAEDLVLSNFSITTSKPTSVDARPVPAKRDTYCDTAHFNKLKEDLKDCKSREKVLEDIVKELTEHKCKLENELEAAVKDVNALKSKLEETVANINQSGSLVKRKHARKIRFLEQQHLKDITDLQSLNNKLSKSVEKLKKELKEKDKECGHLKSQIFFNVNDNIVDVKEGENNAYSVPVRENVIALMSVTGVSAENVNLSYSSCFYGAVHSFSEEHTNVPGHQTALTENEETVIVDYLLAVASLGISVLYNRVNRTSVFATRCIGGSQAELQTFCGLMDLPKPVCKTSYAKIVEGILKASESVQNDCMAKADDEEFKQAEENEGELI